MVDITFVLLGISIILFLGLIAEFIFKKTHIPDILFLIIIGFFIGPNVLKLVEPSEVAVYAPIFTTFALLFLLYEGAFYTSLKSFAQGAAKGLQITIFNFLVSSVGIGIIMYFFGYPIIISMLTGFILGGVSSAFVIPLLKYLRIKKKTYSVLLLEAALTDVLVIVFSFAAIELVMSNSINMWNMLWNIISFFGMAIIVGLIAGFAYILFVAEVLNKNAPYMMTIAYLLIVYALAESMHGNGAIATLVLGIMLKNSRPIIIGIRHRLNRKHDDKKITIVIKTHEEVFYSQVSFFLKTFFFVYIGLLFNINNSRILSIAAVLALTILFLRRLSGLVTKKFPHYDRSVINSMFARGLAAAAIAQVVVISDMPYASDISAITYAFIVFTIILSSITIFIVKKSHHRQQMHNVNV
ncbi:MAG: cation:proton antiporter [Candidatus Woesearchaeota archaeon]